MGGPILAISRLYVRSTLFNPVTWLAMSGALFYAVMTSLDTAVLLSHAGIELGLVELVLVVFFNHSLLMFWGVFLPFVFIVSPMLYAEELERLVAHRAGRRSRLWAAKVLAAAQLAALHFGILLMACVALLAPGTQVSLFSWTAGYTETVLRTVHAPELSLDPHYYWVANGYLHRNTVPIEAAALQGGLLVGALVATGVLCAALAQHLKRQALTLITAVALLSLGLGREPALAFFAPQWHALTSVRTADFPYWVSALYLASLLLALNAAGWHRQQKAPLG